MTAVMLWKEYRQQRAIWLSIAILAVLLVISSAVFQSHGGSLQDMRMMLETDRRLRDSLNLGMLCLAISYGVVSGALLLASESELSTIVFLDCQTGWRGPIWARKLLAGVLLTLALSVALVALSLGLGFGYWENIFVVPLCALDALVWGLVGGAMCRNVLTAVLTGIAFIAVSWFPWPVLDTIVGFALVKMVLALVGCYASWRRFAKNDRLRRAAAVRAVVVDSWDPETSPATERVRPTTRAEKPVRSSGFFSSLNAIVWLSFRQGRWLLVFCLVGTLLFAFVVHTAPLVLWPMGTLGLGLLCGLSVYIHDQKEGFHFLGAQRFPPGRIWLAKMLFWGGTLVALVTLAWILDIAGGFILYSDASLNTNEFRGHRWFDDLGRRAELIPSYVFLGLWPLYGFCFGQFFAQNLRRPVIAVILAVFGTPAVVSLWVPSLLFGGLPVWQLLILPVVLLALTYWNQRPWLADRLYNLWPFLRIGGGVALMNVALAGCFWYRAVEVPDLEEPFDVKAFTDTLPSSKDKDQQAGYLIHKAVDGMQTWRSKVEKDLGPANGGILPRPDIGGPWPQPMRQGMPGPAMPPALDIGYEYQYQSRLLELVAQGWPRHDEEQDKALSLWLDRVCEGEWHEIALKALKLPLGVVFDPREANVRGDFGTFGRDCPNMGRLFVARAYQLQAHNDSRAALNYLDAALALSRHMHNKAPTWVEYNCLEMDAIVLRGMRVWMENVIASAPVATGPDKKELLHAALTLLKEHAAVTPDPVDNVKAQYVLDSKRDPQLKKDTHMVGELLSLSAPVPWEKERQLRLSHALKRAGVGRLLRVADQPIWKGPPFVGPSELVGDDLSAQLAAKSGLPPLTGPGANVSVHQWGEWVKQYDVEQRQEWMTGDPRFSLAPGQTTLLARMLILAVALYQVEHAKLPAELEDLVKAGYLAAVPIDPSSGKPFGYRISPGEFIASENIPVKLEPGQAVIVTPSYSYGTATSHPVPLWKK